MSYRSSRYMSYPESMTPEQDYYVTTPTAQFTPIHHNYMQHGHHLLDRHMSQNEGVQAIELLRISSTVDKLQKVAEYSDARYNLS